MIFATNPLSMKLIFQILAVFLVLSVSAPSLESPYWLAMNASITSAFNSLRSFRDTEVLAARDLYRIYAIEDPNDSGKSKFSWPNASSRPIKLLTDRLLKRTTMTCILLMLARELLEVEIALWLPGFLEPSVEVISSLAVIIPGSIVGISSTPFLLNRFGLRGVLMTLLCGILVSCLGISVGILCQFILRVVSTCCFITLGVTAELVFVIYLSEVFPLCHRGKF